MNAPRACWSVLAQKAQEQVSVIQGQLVQGRARESALRASRDRLQKLYSDYLKPPETGSASQGMQETLNQRQFSTQLLTLLLRVDQDLAQLAGAMAASRRELAVAERERLKMKSLVEQDRLSVQQQSRQREQLQMDALGVAQFNLGARR
jgi:flagellar biosynthesis chaperone FliJ